MSREIPVRIARNFERNLDALREFLIERQAEPVFERLIDELFDEVIPNLSRFPRLGRELLERRPLSVQGELKWDAVVRRLGDGEELRQYIHGEYLLLYLFNEREVLLLAIIIIIYSIDGKTEVAHCRSAGDISKIRVFGEVAHQGNVIVERHFAFLLVRDRV